MKPASMKGAVDGPINLECGKIPFQPLTAGQKQTSGLTGVIREMRGKEGRAVKGICVNGRTERAEARF